MTPFLLFSAFVVATPQAAAPVDIYFHADLDGAFATPACEARTTSEAASSTPRADEPDYGGLVQALEVAREAQPDRASFAVLGQNAVAPDLFTRRLFARDPAKAARGVAFLLGHAHYVAFGVGSHELSWDPSWLEAYLGAMKDGGLPLMPSNVTCGEVARKVRPGYCAAMAAPPLLVSVAGVGRVAFVAAISPRLAAGLAGDRRAGLTLTDGRAFLEKASDDARRAGADLVVALVEAPTRGDGLEELKEWQAALDHGPRPDLLLASGLADEDGRHTVRLLRQDGGPSLSGSTTSARGWTRVTLASPASQTGSGPPEASAETVAAARSGTGELAATLKSWVEDYCTVYGRALGPQVKGLLSYDDFVAYVLEVMRRSAGAEIALLNHRFVKSARFPWDGPITEGDLAQALPYPATLGVANLTGAQVQALLGAARTKPKLVAAGVSRDGPLLVNGRAVDATRSYRVATIAFVAEGGDGLFEAGALPWKALLSSPDVAGLVRDFLVHATSEEDQDPSVSLKTDFGAPPADRPLIVALSDLDLGLANTSVDNGANYTDTQLARSEQRSFKGDLNTVVTFRAPEEDMDGRLRLQYGWTRTHPAGQPAVSGESLDLITGTWTYNDRRLRKVWHPPGWATPDPYARLFLESEFTRPANSPTQTRSYHHAELTATVGASFKPLAKLRLRLGPGFRRELLASDGPGEWRFALEGGATLEPLAVATVGTLPVRLEGNVDYFLLAPTATRAQQLRSSVRLSFPLLPTLFLAVGVDLYGAQYGSGPWQFASDSTASLRVHWDRAYQKL